MTWFQKCNVQNDVISVEGKMYPRTHTHTHTNGNFNNKSTTTIYIYIYLYAVYVSLRVPKLIFFPSDEHLRLNT